MVILEFILSLVFVSLMISLFVSWIIEYWASLFNKKGILLKKMLVKLMDQGDANIWVHRLYQHPMIRSLSYDDKRLTSSIPSQLFSDVVTDLIIDKNPENKGGASFIERIRQGLDKLPDDDFKRIILVFLNKSVDSNTFSKEIEGWYNEYMLRVNHAYKRLLKVPLFILGFIIAVVFNIDAVRITTDLWQNAPLRTNVAGIAEEFMGTHETLDSEDVSKAFFKDYSKKMELPTGWVYEKEYYQQLKKKGNDFSKFFYGLLKIVGFMITGIVSSFGAPFWYDALGKVIDLKKTAKLKME